MRQLEKYRFQDGVTPLSAAELNRRFFDLDGRLHQVELLRVSWQEAVSEVQNFGLARINSVIQPILDQAQGLIDELHQDITEAEAGWQAIQADWEQVEDTLSDFGDSLIPALDTRLTSVETDLAAIQAALVLTQNLAASQPRQVDPCVPDDTDPLR